MDIIDKLLDVQKQATLERSHYYVVGCITEAIQEIKILRSKNVIHSDVATKCPKCSEKSLINATICLRCAYVKSHRI